MENIFSQIIFKIKTVMLCNGIHISRNTLLNLQEKGILKSLGREGGAGPAGGRYFIISYEGNNNEIIHSSLVNAQIWIDNDVKDAKNAKGANNVNDEIHDILPPSPDIFISDIDKEFIVSYQCDFSLLTKIINTTPDFILQIKENVKLTLIQSPKFYSESSNEGIRYKKIGLIHGNKTYATTIHQKCVYWEEDSQKCKFCGIENALNTGTTLEDKTPKQVVEGMKAASLEDELYVSNITLTSGTFKSSDEGMERYANVIREIKKPENFPESNIHIQTEPLDNIEWYEKIHDIGADTIGIHLEILDNEKRKKICPGKSVIPKARYYTHWKKTIEIFGVNQVSSYILMGFEKDLQKFKLELEEIIKIGVVPLITPTRIIPKKLGNQDYTPMTTYDDMIDVLEFAASKCKEYGVDPSKHKAGCIKCGGCSAIVDAYQLLM